MNWTIVTVIVCSMLVSSGISSYLRWYFLGLANDLDDLKARLDRIERLGE